MADLVIPNTFVEKTKAKASEVNENFDAIKAFANTTGISSFQDGDYGALTIASDAFSLQYQQAACSSPLTIGTAAGDIAGATITVAKSGTYVALGIFDFSVEAPAAAAATTIAIGTCLVNGVAQNGSAQLLAKSTINLTNNVRATVSQFWVISATATQIVKLQAIRQDSGGGGAASAQAAHTKLFIVRLV
jgi:hypothetical protein